MAAADIFGSSMNYFKPPHAPGSFGGVYHLGSQGELVPGLPMGDQQFYKQPSGNYSYLQPPGTSAPPVNMAQIAGNATQGQGLQGTPGGMGLPNYNSLTEWLKNLNSPGMAYETPDAAPRGPTWT